MYEQLVIPIQGTGYLYHVVPQGLMAKPRNRNNNNTGQNRVTRCNFQFQVLAR